MGTVGDAYVKATAHVIRGEYYYDTGELRYRGEYVHPEGQIAMPCGIGTEYYKNGVIKKEGLFQRRGLVCGRMYYPSGKLRFEGYCTEPTGYGPAYPTRGSFYAEDGTLVYEGVFRCTFGGVGYPRVTEPEGFGPLG